MKSSVTKVVIYRVEIEVPDRTWTLFHDRWDYQVEIQEATSGNVSAGSHCYSEAIEWAEFHTEAEANRCEHLLRKAIELFNQKAVEYDEAARKEMP